MAEYWPDTITCRIHQAQEEHEAASGRENQQQHLGAPGDRRHGRVDGGAHAGAGRARGARAPRGAAEPVAACKAATRREEAEARAVREEARRGSSKERPRTRPVREASARRAAAAFVGVAVAFHGIRAPSCAPPTLRQRQAAGAIGGDDIGRQRRSARWYSGAGAAMPRAVRLGLDARGVRQHALRDTSSSLPSARAVSMLVCSERVSSAQEAAAEVMATRAMAMSAMTMQMTAQAFARESAASTTMPSLWARRPAPGTTEMEGASSKESSSASRRVRRSGRRGTAWMRSAGASGGGAPIRDAVGAGARTCASMMRRSSWPSSTAFWFRAQAVPLSA